MIIISSYFSLYLPACIVDVTADVAPLAPSFIHLLFSYLFRFHEHWRFVLQRLAFLAAFVVYLESEALVTREEVAQILGSRYQFNCYIKKIA